MMRKRVNSASGSVLALVMFLTFLLFVMTSIIGQNAVQNASSTSRTTDQKRARYAAYSGLQLALATLNHTADKDFAVAAPVTLTGSMPENPNISFTVTMRNNIYGDLPNEIVPKGAVKLESQAKFKDRDIERDMGGLVGNAVQINPSFDQAIYGNTVNLGHGSKALVFDFNKYVDYLRNDSAYDTDTSVQDDKWGKGAKVVCSTFNIAVADASKIHGDVAYLDPPSSDSPVAAAAGPAFASLPGVTPLHKGIEYTGDRVPAGAAPLPGMRPPYDRARATTVLDNFDSSPMYDGRGNLVGYDTVDLAPGPYQSVSVPSGQSIRLSSGTYYFADDFVINGSVLLSDYGSSQTIIYVGKKMVVNGRVNPGGKPERLQAYFSDEDDTPDPGERVLEPDKFKVSRLSMNGGKATMAVGGSKLRVGLDAGAELLGSVVADRTMLDHGSKVKFDSNLAGQSTLMKSEWKLTGVRDR